MEQPPQLMNITTEQIQKLLEENKKLIMAIMENHNQGKLAESVPFQAQLQQNLMFLANIADAQSEAATSSQMQQEQEQHVQSAQAAMVQQEQHVQNQSAQAAMVQQEQHVQSAQAAMAQQHPGFLAQKFPFHSSVQQRLIYLQQQQQQQQQQLNQPQVGLRSGGPSGAYQGMQTGFGNNSPNTQDDAVDGFRNLTYGRRR